MKEKEVIAGLIKALEGVLKEEDKQIENLGVCPCCGNTKNVIYFFENEKLRKIDCSECGNKYFTNY